MSKNKFKQQLLAWSQIENNRNLPWKSEKDPYKIWLSEIILQQTRAEQGLPYYLNFINQYPTIFDLASASEQAIFKLWQGLGYYSRCKNLIITAKHIAQNLNGKFPDTYETILTLKGVGPYTAAAIASFAYNLPEPVIDGNVYRVLSRYFADSTPIDTTQGKKHFKELVISVFDNKNPALFNQAIMDFGATVCTPKNPKCEVCYLNSFCASFLENTSANFPVKTKSIVVKERTFNYFVLIFKDEIYIQQRQANDIWQSLYEWYLIENTTFTIPDFVKENEVESADYQMFSSKQKLTHQLIKANFSIIKLHKKPKINQTNALWVKIKNLKNYAFPKTIVSFLEEIHYF